MSSKMAASALSVNRWRVILTGKWDLCEYVIVHTIWGGSPVILWISLGGKPKWLPLHFGYHDVMRTSPIGPVRITSWYPKCNGSHWEWQIWCATPSSVISCEEKSKLLASWLMTDDGVAHRNVLKSNNYFVTGFVIPSINLCIISIFSCRLRNCRTCDGPWSFALVVGWINNNWLNLWKRCVSCVQRHFASSHSYLNVKQTNKQTDIWSVGLQSFSSSSVTASLLKPSSLFLQILIVYSVRVTYLLQFHLGLTFTLSFISFQL